MTLTKEYLNDLFEYKDGELFYKVNRFRKTIGSKAGSKKPDGRYHVHIKGKSYLLHRLIFMMHHGYFPEMVDHIDLDNTNNRIENLRAAKHAENAWNSNARVDSVSGIKNVKFNPRLKKWQVNVQANNVRRYLGCYADLELAELVAMEARNKYHGQFARHGSLMTAEQAKDFVKELP